MFLADRSVDAPPVSHERFTFTRKFIGASDTEAFMTMDSWVRDSIGSQAGDLLLQCMLRTANGRLTAAEALGHNEFVMTRLYESA